MCANPKCSKTGVHLCSGCSEEIYCSKDCQKVHWPAHKTACQAAAKSKLETPLTQSFDSLSVKQLKNVLIAKVANFEKSKKEKILNGLTNHVEKKELIKYISGYVKINEVESLLQAPPPSPTAGSSSDATTGSSSSGSKRRPLKPKAAPAPTPSQIHQQAMMMRKHPDMVRKANPAFAKMTDEQIRQYADHLEQVSTLQHSVSK